MTIEKQIDELTKETFRFWIKDNLIILDSYYFFRRENTRKRNYNVLKKYERLNGRDNNITLQEVPLTEELKAEVLEEYTKTLKIMTWEEYKNK
jgi:hypothetical protein